MSSGCILVKLPVTYKEWRSGRSLRKDTATGSRGRASGS